MLNATSIQTWSKAEHTSGTRFIIKEHLTFGKFSLSVTRYCSILLSWTDTLCRTTGGHLLVMWPFIHSSSLAGYSPSEHFVLLGQAAFYSKTALLPLHAVLQLPQQSKLFRCLYLKLPNIWPSQLHKTVQCWFLNCFATTVLLLSIQKSKCSNKNCSKVLKFWGISSITSKRRLNIIRFALF